MVEYAYRDLFYKSHQTKDILIVDEMANVTPVTGTVPTVTNATVEIHTADVKTNTFRLEESLCSEDDLTWGLLESAEVSFTINNKASIPNLKTNNDDLMLNIYIYFNGDSDTLFQVGQYICYSDKYSADRRTREIVLYDANHFLRDWDITEWYNEVYADNNNEPLTVKELRDSLFEYIATDFDYIIEQNEETELVNDDYYVPKNIESDTITFGFFMGGLLNANGVFGHISRTGVFEYLTLVKYDAETVGTVTDDFRKPPTTYEDFAVWGIGYVRVYDQNNIQLAYEGSSSYRHPSVYNIVDNFVLSGIKSLPDGEENIKQATLNIREQVTHRRYAPMNVEHVGDLCIEVGDNIKVVGDIGDYNTYVLERHLKGLGTMLDRYISRGNRKQPKYKINSNWHIGDSDSGTSGFGSDGVSYVDDDWKTKFVKAIRNIGFRLLSEPSNVSVEYDAENGEVSIMWTDPADISNSHPSPADWAGTVVVRKEDSAPWYPWDGTILVNSTTRDAYANMPFVDNTVEANKRYYYGIMPYDSKGDYRFTKVVSVNTGKNILAPSITSIFILGTSVTLTLNLTENTWDWVKVTYKKDYIPADYTDGTAVAVTGNQITITDLDANEKYYFVLFAKDLSTGMIYSSEPKSGVTYEPIRQLQSMIVDSTSCSLMEINDISAVSGYEGWGINIYQGYTLPEWVDNVGTNLGTLFPSEAIYDDTQYIKTIDNSTATLIKYGYDSVTQERYNAVSLIISNNTKVENGYYVVLRNDTTTEYAVVLNDMTEKGFVLLHLYTNENRLHKFYIYNDNGSKSAEVYNAFKNV